MLCGPKCVHVHVQGMHAAIMRSSVHLVSRQTWRVLNTRLSTQCLHKFTSIHRVLCARAPTESGDTEYGMSCALGFLATYRKYNQGARASMGLLSVRGG
jgi:hypothetical protein